MLSLTISFQISLGSCRLHLGDVDEHSLPFHPASVRLLASCYLKTVPLTTLARCTSRGSPRLVVPLGILVGIGGLLLIIFSQGRIYWRLACPGYILYSYAPYLAVWRFETCKLTHPLFIDAR